MLPVDVIAPIAGVLLMLGCTSAPPGDARTTLWSGPAHACSTEAILDAHGAPVTRGTRLVTGEGPQGGVHADVVVRSSTSIGPLGARLEGPDGAVIGEGFDGARYESDGGPIEVPLRIYLDARELTGTLRLRAVGEQACELAVSIATGP